MGLFGRMFGRGGEPGGPSPERQKEVKKQSKERKQIVDALMEDPAIKKAIDTTMQSPSEEQRMSVEANRVKLEEAVDRMLAEGKGKEEIATALADNAKDLFGVGEPRQQVEEGQIESEEAELPPDEPLFEMESGGNALEALAKADPNNADDVKATAKAYLLETVSEMPDGKETLKEHIQGFEGANDEEKMDNFVDSQLVAFTKLQIDSVKNFGQLPSKADKLLKGTVQEKLAGKQQKKAA